MADNNSPFDGFFDPNSMAPGSGDVINQGDNNEFISPPVDASQVDVTDTPAAPAAQDPNPAKPQDSSDNQSLKDLISQLQLEVGTLKQQGVQQQADNQRQEQEREQQQQQEQQNQVIEFIRPGTDMGEYLSSPENVNNLLNEVYRRGMADAAPAITSQVMSQLPAVTSQYVTNQLSSFQAAQEFYANNQDLADPKVKPYFFREASDLANKNPGWSNQQVLDEAGKNIRGLLGINPNAGQNDNNGRMNHFAPANNNLAQQNGRQAGGRVMTQTEQEMGAMLQHSR